MDIYIGDNNDLVWRGVVLTYDSKFESSKCKYWDWSVDGRSCFTLSVLDEEECDVTFKEFIFGVSNLSNSSDYYFWHDSKAGLQQFSSAWKLENCNYVVLEFRLEDSLYQDQIDIEQELLFIRDYLFEVIISI